MREHEVEIQPFLPRVRLIWSFVAITFAALLIVLVRAVDQSAALISAIVGIAFWMILMFALFSILFLVTYALGLLEDLLAPLGGEIQSPFATDRLPEQIVIPIKTDAI